MRNRVVVVCISLAMMATAALPQSSGTDMAANKSPIEGVWRADMEGLPAIALTITNESGSLSGAVLFYFHRRDAVGQPWTSMPPRNPEPLFNPKFDGKTLTFQVSHRRAHPPGSLNDPPVTFRFTLTGVDEASLINESEPQSVDGNAASTGLPMVRTDY
jgi:hypothetical protein